jgi:hypothetical protein
LVFLDVLRLLPDVPLHLNYYRAASVAVATEQPTTSSAVIQVIPEPEVVPIPGRQIVAVGEETQRERRVLPGFQQKDPVRFAVRT